jgi:NOL1/NOP2/fmu family ribosome biogenesis protein
MGEDTADAGSNADGEGETRTEDDAQLEQNVGQRFDQLPETADDRAVEGRVSREAVVGYFTDRFGIDPEVFDDYTFWEKGAGKIWIYAGSAPSPLRIEAIGMTCLRTRQEHWKPTTDFVQRFGRHASECVIDLDSEEARAFAAGEEQEIERWDGNWGYLIAAHEVAGEREPIGVGLYVHGELRSTVPKGRQRDL